MRLSGPASAVFALFLVALFAVTVNVVWLSEPSKAPPDLRPPEEVVAEVEPELAKKEPPAGSHPVVKVRKGGRVELLTRPKGEVAAVVGDRTEFGSPTVFGVVKQRGQWLGVTAPEMSNSGLGWIRFNPRKLRKGWTFYSIHVNLEKRQAMVKFRDEALHDFPVTIGAPGTETPVGHFAVTDTFRGNLHPSYGCCAVAISAVQTNLAPDWTGGDRVAIHGNGSGGPLGEAISNGCIRAENEDVSALINHIDLGTPVFIRQ